jgi:hypothetical protein
MRQRVKNIDTHCSPLKFLISNRLGNTLFQDDYRSGNTCYRFCQKPDTIDLNEFKLL